MQTLQSVPTSEELLVPSLPLDEVIAGAREGKNAYVGEIARRFGDRLLARLYPIGPNLAGEVVTDTLMALPARLPGYRREEGKFERWLLKIAVNRLRTRRRSEDRRRETTGSTALRNFVGPSATTTSTRTSEQQAVVARLLADLPPRERQVWELLEADLRPAEVARQLEIQVSSVYVMKKRAKDKLRAAREQLGL